MGCVLHVYRHQISTYWHSCVSIGPCSIILTVIIIQPKSLTIGDQRLHEWLIKPTLYCKYKICPFSIFNFAVLQKIIITQAKAKAANCLNSSFLTCVHERKQHWKPRRLMSESSEPEVWININEHQDLKHESNQNIPA